MINAKFFQEFSQQFSDGLPPRFQEFRDEFEKLFLQGLESAFQRLKLVTREEFDIQAAVLLRSREKIQELEQKLLEIEALLSTRHE